LTEPIAIGASAPQAGGSLVLRRWRSLSMAMNSISILWTEITAVGDKFQLRCVVGGAQITQHPHHGLP
jgi:hypothetical protein